MQNSTVYSTCNKAQTIITDPQSGEIICGSCGLVVLDKIPVSGLEWGTFIADGRTGFPSSLARYNMGLSTIIGWTNKDSIGHYRIMIIKYRDRIEIIMLMLRSSNADNASAKTKIMYESFLTFAQLEEYLFLLLRDGLLEYSGTNRTYKTTEKGVRLLELFNKLNELLETRIRQMAIRIPNGIKMFIATIAIQVLGLTVVKKRSHYSIAEKCLSSFRY